MKILIFTDERSNQKNQKSLYKNDAGFLYYDTLDRILYRHVTSKTFPINTIQIGATFNYLVSGYDPIFLEKLIKDGMLEKIYDGRTSLKPKGIEKITEGGYSWEYVKSKISKDWTIIWKIGAVISGVAGFIWILIKIYEFINQPIQL